MTDAFTFLKNLQWQVHQEPTGQATRTSSNAPVTMVTGEGWTGRDPVNRKEATWSCDARRGLFLCGSWIRIVSTLEAGEQEKEAKLSFLELVLKTVSQSGSVKAWRVMEARVSICD